jgi:cyclopropane-fatty-acyl-phospholipid synthase
MKGTFAVYAQAQRDKYRALYDAWLIYKVSIMTRIPSPMVQVDFSSTRLPQDRDADVFHARGLLARLLDGVHTQSDIALRVVLWNGLHYDLHSAPQVTVQLTSPKALQYFLPPSLDHLAEGYVQGHLNVQGTARAVVQVASQLAHLKVPMQGAFGRIFSPKHHDRHCDAQAIAQHYDVSNAFYRQWLDDAMVYSCAYYAQPEMTLSQAQFAKLDHILTKIMLKPGERLLDIGCGWGALPIHAAKKYGAYVVGVTLSRNQYEMAQQRVAEEGLQDQVEIRHEDYRDLAPYAGQFDKITSVGMFEHVGLSHLPEYFAKMKSLLKDGGLVLNHGITSTDPESGCSPLGAGRFIGKYVFHNGEVPHISLALRAMQQAGLEALDVECLRRHYAQTLLHWSDNYERHLGVLQAMVDEKTFRVWRVYLAGCAHAFNQNWVSVHQILACKSGTMPSLNPTPWSRSYMYPSVSQ